MDNSATIPTNQRRPPFWMKYVLIASGLHSGVWGIFIIVAPTASAKVYGFSETPHDIHLWQGAGLFILLLALCYGLASTNPAQHWGLVLIGLLAKVLGAIGMCGSVIQGQVASGVLWLIPINDVIWWIPFALIVRYGFSATSSEQLFHA